MSMTDGALLDEVQRRTLRYFTDFAHPVSGLARDRTNPPADDPHNDKISIGGSGFGIMALVAGVERGFIGRGEAVARLANTVAFLERADRWHGVFPHFLDGTTGRVIPFFGKDDGADLVETAFLMMGLITARQYFSGRGAEADLRAAIARLWEAVDWRFHLPAGQESGADALLWHWSPNYDFGMNMHVRGWNECLVVYVLAIASPTHAIDPAAYHTGFAQGRDFTNGATDFGIRLPLGPHLGGPLFFTHYSFMGLDPRGLADRYADYFAQNVAHCRTNHAWCVANPMGYRGYGPECWGLTASDSDGMGGYHAHAPGEHNDLGVISPTAAVASLPYVADEAMAAIRHFHGPLGDRLFGEMGFMDAFNPTTGWHSNTHLAIDQGPIVGMIENARSGLLWSLFMSCPEIEDALGRMGFRVPLSAVA